jgi:hypothetical protein
LTLLPLPPWPLPAHEQQATNTRAQSPRMQTAYFPSFLSVSIPFLSRAKNRAALAYPYVAPSVPICCPKQCLGSSFIRDNDRLAHRLLLYRLCHVMQEIFDLGTEMVSTYDDDDDNNFVGHKRMCAPRLVACLQRAMTWLLRPSSGSMDTLKQPVGTKSPNAGNHG